VGTRSGAHFQLLLAAHIGKKALVTGSTAGIGFAIEETKNAGNTFR
jgi:hypothetical protein